MKKVFQSKYKKFESEINQFVLDFDNTGEQIKDARNKLKLFPFNDRQINIKSFKVPNLINQIVYKFIRKSKAQRSFEYANKLLDLGIGTPNPIAYYEFSSVFLYKRSFYVSEQLESDLTYRELIMDFDYPNHEEILRAFTRFTFRLHEKGINFLDHSPGNTLIKKISDDYKFYLVDLNRMNFGVMSFEARMKNFSRLTKFKPMIEVMSDEYAKCIEKDYDTVFNAMWKSTQIFRSKIERKKRLKKKLKF